MVRHPAIVILFLGLSACGEYDCTNREVQSAVFENARYNLALAMTKSDQPKLVEFGTNVSTLYSLRQLYSLPDPTPEIQAKARSVLAEIRKSLDNFSAIQQSAKFSFADLVQISEDPKLKNYVCSGHLAIAVNGITGQLLVRFSVQRNLSNGDPFVIRVWM